MKIAVPQKPDLPENMPNVIEITRQIIDIERQMSYSAAGNDNWRAKNAIGEQLANLKRTRDILVEDNREQYKVNLKKYYQDIEAYNKMMQEEELRIKERQKDAKDPIQSLEI